MKSPFGGLIIMVSPEGKNSIKFSLEKVVEVPWFDLTNPNSASQWETKYGDRNMNITRNIITHSLLCFIINQIPTMIYSIDLFRKKLAAPKSIFEGRFFFLVLDTNEDTRAATAEGIESMLKFWDKTVEAFGYFTGLNITHRKKEGFVTEVQLPVEWA